MKAFKRRFASKEVKDTLDVLNEIASEFDYFDYAGLQFLWDKLEGAILAGNKEIVARVKEGVSPRVLVYNAIVILAEDLVTTGEYHVHRGALGVVGHNLLKLFDKAIEGLAQNGVIDANCADEQKAEIREAIKNVG